MYKLLLVDDEIMIRNGIKAAIDWLPLGVDEVFTVASGIEALKLLTTQHIDIMFSDINMNEMNGLELIARCKRDYPEVRIIVLSGYDDFEYARESLRLDVLDYLLKPIGKEILIDVVKKQVKYLDDLSISKRKEPFIHRTVGTELQINFQEIFVKLFHGKSLSDKEQGLLNLNMFFDPDQIVQVVTLFSSTEMYNANRDYLNGNILMQVCIKIVDTKEIGLSIRESNKKIILIFFTKSLNVSIEEIMNDIKKDIVLKGYNPPSFRIGSKVKGLAHLNISYNETTFTINEKREELRKDYQIKQSCFNKEEYSDLFIKIKNTMCHVIMDKNQVMMQFDEFVKSLLVFNISTDELRHYCFELTSDLYYEFYDKSHKSMQKGKMKDLMEALTLATKDDALSITKGSIEFLYIEEEQLQSNDVISNATSYIKCNLNKDIGVSFLAKKFNYTSNYFSRLFKKEIGMGCNEYVTKMRNEKAQYLLNNTNFPTGKIAGMLGFHDINYFSSAFKRNFGLSPTAYRKENRTHKN